MPRCFSLINHLVEEMYWGRLSPHWHPGGPRHGDGDGGGRAGDSGGAGGEGEVVGVAGEATAEPLSSSTHAVN